MLFSFPELAANCRAKTAEEWSDWRGPITRGFRSARGQWLTWMLASLENVRIRVLNDIFVIDGLLMFNPGVDHRSCEGIQSTPCKYHRHYYVYYCCTYCS